MVVDIKNIVTRLPELRFTAPVNWRIDEGQQWAVVGPNGAGKTLIADIMQRKFAFKEGEVVFSGDGKVSDFIKSIAFKDIYSLADCRNSYYQQRWHSTETEEMPIVEELLKEYAGSDNLAKILTLFGIEDLLPKRLIFLSSGELRKFLIVRTLLSRPRVLILDNPFIGLDAPSRDLLVEMLGQMTKLNGVQVVLLLSNTNDIPAMITHVLPIHDRTCLPPLTREEFMSDTELIARLFPTEGIHACEEVGIALYFGSSPFLYFTSGVFNDTFDGIHLSSVKFGNNKNSLNVLDMFSKILAILYNLLFFLYFLMYID